jgi:hypothetical protein
VDPRWRSSLVVGARLGALCGALGGVEILASNARTINPSSGALLAAACLALGALAGAGAGLLGARGFEIVRWRRSDGAVFLATVFAGYLVLPPGYGLAGGAALWLLRAARRRLLPRQARLDGLAVLLAAAVGVEALLGGLPPSPPAISPAAPLAPGSPLPGSLSVTISVHPRSDFPEVPAVHLPLQPLAAARAGRLAALWTGRAPVRTRIGADGPHRLPGGGSLIHAPEQPGARALLALLGHTDPSDPDPRRLTGSLPLLAESAGIPVLTTPPSPLDPVLCLRLLTGDDAPRREVAEEIRRAGAWIDVTLGPRSDAEIALSGRGFALARAEGGATLMDVTPTALHLLGLAVPRDCDGRVLWEFLDKESPAARPPRYVNLRGIRAEPAAGSQSRTSES